MKTLIMTIIVAILAISVSGCTFVREYHREHHRPVAVVTHPQRVSVRPRGPRSPHPHRHYEWRHHPRFGH
jgi:hypothetical protein